MAGRVLISSGTGVCAASVVLKTGLTLEGMGRNITKFQLAASANTDLVTANLTNIVDVTLEKLSLEGNRANNTSGIGLMGTGITYLTLRDVFINEFPHEGLWGLCSAGRTPYDTGWWTLDNVIIRKCGVSTSPTPANVKYAINLNGLYAVFADKLDSSYNYGPGGLLGSLYECYFDTITLDQNDQVVAEIGLAISGGERIYFNGGYVALNKYGLSFSDTKKFEVIGVNLYQNTEYALRMGGTSLYDALVLGNTFEGTAEYGYGIGLVDAADKIRIGPNTVRNYTASNFIVSTTTGKDIQIEDNVGYIAPGEERPASGALTAGNANAFAFAWQNPESQAIWAQLMVEITTAGGTAGALLDAGSGASATTASDNMIDGADLNATNLLVSSAWVKLDANGGATDYITGQILVQNAASLAGRFFVKYIGAA